MIIIVYICLRSYQIRPMHVCVCKLGALAILFICVYVYTHSIYIIVYLVTLLMLLEFLASGWHGVALGNIAAS